VHLFRRDAFLQQDVGHLEATTWAKHICLGLRPPQPRLDVKPIAVKFFNAIFAGQPDDRLKWEGSSKVRVLIGKVIPRRSAV